MVGIPWSVSLSHRYLTPLSFFSHYTSCQLPSFVRLLHPDTPSSHISHHDPCLLLIRMEVTCNYIRSLAPSSSWHCSSTGDPSTHSLMSSTLESLNILVGSHIASTSFMDLCCTFLAIDCSPSCGLSLDGNHRSDMQVAGRCLTLSLW